LTRPLAAIVMAAGLGTRMRSDLPKHLHPLLGRRVIDWALDPVALGPERVVVVCSPETCADLESSLPEGVETALQHEGHSAASHRALATQGRRAAAERTRADRSAAARKAARTKGPVGRVAAARKAAATRAKHARRATG